MFGDIFAANEYSVFWSLCLFVCLFVCVFAPTVCRYVSISSHVVVVASRVAQALYVMR
jgi:hypothetical protein